MWRRLRLLERPDYVAPRHMRAIKAVGGDLRVAFDPNNSVGIIDSYFPDASFFVEFERFDRHIDKLRRRGEKDRLRCRSARRTICMTLIAGSRLRSDADAICEKPLVLNPWNIDGLSEIELESGRRISTILQLRLHPAIQALKARIEASPQNEFAVDLTYIASRGRWYHDVMEGRRDEVRRRRHQYRRAFLRRAAPTSLDRRSTNIAHLRDRNRAAGFLVCGRAAIRWFLSVDRNDLPFGRQRYDNLPLDHRG